MKNKHLLRKKFLKLRKKKYYEIPDNKLSLLIEYIKKRIKKKKLSIIALYYPSNFEFNIFKILNYLKKYNTKFLLPIVQDSRKLKFERWDERDILLVNKFGIPEPIKSKKNYLPDIVLVPLLAFDNEKNRLGYGKGFYDKYLSNLVKINTKAEAIGIAFSFQKYKKIPTSKFDFQLNRIFTEKGFMK